MAKKVRTRARWSAGRVFNSVTYSFIAQKLMKAKKTSDQRLLSATAAKKIAAINHQARTRAASSVKLACGRARLSAATTPEAATSTPNTSKPICMTGESPLTIAAIFIRSTSARVRLRQFGQPSSQAIPASPQRQQRGDRKHPRPRRQRRPNDERDQAQRPDDESAVAFTHR